MRRERRMSGERTISATIRYAETWPSIEVSYRDPESYSIDAPTDQSTPSVDRPRSPSAHPLSVRSSWRWLRSGLDNLVEQPASQMPSLFVTAAVLGIASILCFAVWWKSIPRVSANTLLTRAEACDASAGTKKTPGVIYQKVAIRMARRTVERAIYRDPQGIRRPRRQSLSPEDEQLKNKLATAGVNWDAPLLAADYAALRHHLGATSDRVAQSGPHLLTLTTTPPAGSAILKETLTVRDIDFHAVDRTVELRDSGTVEIAELNYDVMPWGAVNQDWFEPILGNTNMPAPGILPPHAISIRELNKTELEVRYLLHKTGADLGDPIDVRINDENSPPVSVVGIVQSESQKQGLSAQLRQISHVAIRLQTEEEAAEVTLRNQPKMVKRAEPEPVSEHSPIEAQLLDHFGDSSVVENFSSHAAAIADNLVAHAWAMRRLSERYGPPGSAKEQALDPPSLQLLQTIRRDHLKAMADATSELSALLEPVLTSIAEPYECPASERPPLAIAEEVRNLTVGLLSGFEAARPTEDKNPREAAETLLAALHRLAAVLKDQP
jgi:hypothetical protein